MFNRGSCLSDAPKEFTGDFMYLYRFDSYDQTALLGSRGERLVDPDTGEPGYQLAYSTDWTGVLFGITPNPQQDADNQLKYRDPPLNKTVLTLCSYHAVVAH